MTGHFLSTVVEEVRGSLARGTYSGPEPSAPSPPPPSLRAAVASAPEGRTLIVELKRASPGRADPRLPIRSVPEFVRATDVAGVGGYSCLATVPRFDGSPELVRELARSTPRPVLFKDFVVAPAQVEAARRCGASAVLLIARLESEGLLDVPLRELAERAHALGLEVLLELHRPKEIASLDSVPADLVGVNVRDLDTLRIDVPIAMETLARLRGPSRLPLVGLSGVESPLDARRFWEAGCSAIVVGTSVALAGDPAAFLRSLLSSGSRP